MQKSENYFMNNKFSHIYVEKNILNHELTQEILLKFKSSEVVLVDHYKDVFNKSNQLFCIQKRSMKLILAEKKEPFLYKGSDMCDSFGHDNFYYNTSAMNCIYNCDYCYLQGLYSSGNLVVFVNLDDVFDKLNRLDKSLKTYICISYDTDLLAIENLTGFVRRWIDFASRNRNIDVELRTKSCNYFLISDMEPVSGFILSWSISPREVISLYEKGTPNLEERLKSIKSAVEKGWEVRLCVDPVIYTPNYKKSYFEMSELVKKSIDTKLLQNISIGVFRVPGDSLKKMRRNNPESSLLSYPFEFDKISGSYTYSIGLKDEIISYVKKLFDISGD